MRRATVAARRQQLDSRATNGSAISQGCHPLTGRRGVGRCGADTTRPELAAAFSLSSGKIKGRVGSTSGPCRAVPVPGRAAATSSLTHPEMRLVCHASGALSGALLGGTLRGREPTNQSDSHPAAAAAAAAAYAS